MRGRKMSGVGSAKQRRVWFWGAQKTVQRQHWGGKVGESPAEGGCRGVQGGHTTTQAAPQELWPVLGAETHRHTAYPGRERSLEVRG